MSASALARFTPFDWASTPLLAIVWRELLTTLRRRSYGGLPFRSFFCIFRRPDLDRVLGHISGNGSGDFTGDQRVRGQSTPPDQSPPIVPRDSATPIRVPVGGTILSIHGNQVKRRVHENIGIKRSLGQMKRYPVSAAHGTRIGVAESRGTAKGCCIPSEDDLPDRLGGHDA